MRMSVIVLGGVFALLLCLNAANAQRGLCPVGTCGIHGGRIAVNVKNCRPENCGNRVGSNQTGCSRLERRWMGNKLTARNFHHAEACRGR